MTFPTYYDQLFLYSQDLSNCTTQGKSWTLITWFLYSQDLSNCTTLNQNQYYLTLFLYSQDLSNCTTAISSFIP